MNQRYLELGIAKAKCFNKVAGWFDEAWAVDINKGAYKYIDMFLLKGGIDNKREVYFDENSTDNFFKLPGLKKFNLIFIDANHDFGYVKKDFINSWKVLGDNGIIILHDTYPPDREYLDHCKDSYKINGFLRMHRGFVRDEDDGYSGVISQSITGDDGYCMEQITLPFYFGLTIVRKYKKHLAWKE